MEAEQKYKECKGILKELRETDKAERIDVRKDGKDEEEKEKQKEEEREEKKKMFVRLNWKKSKEQIEQWYEQQLRINIGAEKIGGIRGRKNKVGAKCRSKEDKKSIISKKRILKEHKVKVFIDHDTTWR